jgi:hypothetical protein
VLVLSLAGVRSEEECQTAARRYAKIIMKMGGAVKDACWEELTVRAKKTSLACLGLLWP